MIYHGWKTEEPKWDWVHQRVYDPFCKCEKSGKLLFLQKAYRGNDGYGSKRWLSEKEYVWSVLRDD